LSGEDRQHERADAEALHLCEDLPYVVAFRHQPLWR
jgi:hypothetical protein